MIQCFIKYNWSTIFNFTCEYLYSTWINNKLSYNTQVLSHIIQDNLNTQAIYIWLFPIHFSAWNEKNWLVVIYKRVSSFQYII